MTQERHLLINELLSGGVFSLSPKDAPNSPSVFQVTLLIYHLPYPLRQIIGYLYLVSLKRKHCLICLWFAYQISMFFTVFLCLNMILLSLTDLWPHHSFGSRGTPWLGAGTQRCSVPVCRRIVFTDAKNVLPHLQARFIKIFSIFLTLIR